VCRAFTTIERAVRPAAGLRRGETPRGRRPPRRSARRHPRLHHVPPKTCGPRFGPTTAERLNKEIRRRTDAVEILPKRDAIVRLVGAVPTEQTDEWAEGRRYLGLVLTRCRITVITQTQPEIGTDDLPALTA
jgi:Transposase, Mutator family